LNNVRFLWGLVGSLILLVAVVSWAWLQESRTYKTVAVAGGKSITEKEWVELLKQKYGEQTLNELINQAVVFQEADKLGITVDEQRLNAELEKLQESSAEQHSTEEVTGEQASADQEHLKTIVRYQLLLKELATRDIAVTEEEMKSYYSKHKKDYSKPARVHAMQIVVSSLKEANQVQKELRDGGNFNTIAKERSIDQLTAANGGDLGWVTFEDDLPENVLSTLDSLPPHTDSEPVETPLGYAIIRVIEREEAYEKSFEEVKDEVRREVALAKVASLDEIVERLRQSYRVEVKAKTSD